MHLKVWVHALTALFLFLPLSSFADPVANREGWYLSGQPQDAADMGRERDVVELYARTTEQCLNAFGSAKMANLKREFGGKLYFTRYVPAMDASRTTARSQKQEEAEFARTQQPGTLEIVLHGQDAEGSPRLTAPLQYQEAWSAVFVPAQAWSKPWFCAVFAHELSHASEHRQRKVKGVPGATFASIPWAEEEVRGHEIERDVLNAFTDGRYVATIKGFFENGRHKGKMLKDVIETAYVEVTPQLVKLFPPPASPYEAQIRDVQMSIDIDFLAYDRNGATFADKTRRYLSAFGLTEK